MNGVRVLVGITGGIAAYKTCEVVRGLVKRGAEVQVLMTENATRFVTPLTFEALSLRPTRVTEYDVGMIGTGHIDLARWGNVMVIAPATANTLAQMASGHASSLISTVYLAFTGPVIVAPAMNTRMLEHPATGRNLDQLLRDGVTILPTQEGVLACGEKGLGAMAATEDVIAAIEMRCGPRIDRSLAGVRVLVTAGATRESIDPVRYLTNPSSGLMGLCLAQAARDRGAQVVLVHGTLPDGDLTGIETVSAPSVLDMYREALARAGSADVFIASAAAGDFVARNPADQKIKKPSQGGITIELDRAPDILSSVGESRRKGQIIVGFAAETENLLSNARSKLEAKGADMIVANDVSSPTIGFSSLDNQVTILYRDREPEQLDRSPKSRIAVQIIERVRELLDRSGRESS